MIFNLSDDTRNRLDRIFRPGRPPIIAVHVTQKDGIVELSDGSRKLRILSEHRARKYKRGIATRLLDLAEQYGIPKYVKVRPGDLVVNIGANIGELTIFLAEAGARVAAIEPDNYTFQCLDQNTKGLNVELIKKALWKLDEPVLFDVDPADANSHILESGGMGVWIDAQRLDTLMADRDGPIRLIVGDAEGSEPEVLLGATETLKRTEYVSLDCGYERQGKRTLEDCAKLLTGRGFAIVRYQKTKRCNLVAHNKTFSA